MHTLKRISTALLALVTAGVSTAAEFSSLEERMSQQQFHAAGLDKLTPGELQALNDWLRTHQSTTYVTPGGKPVFNTQPAEREAFETRIDGRFGGWYGKSVFKLENGQEWTQAESGQLSVGPYDHPKVKVKPMLIGAWLMYVEPCGCSVRVERTK